MDDLDILFLIVSADVVSLDQTTLLLYHINALGMIFHIQPVTDILAVAVYRKLLALQRIVDDQRDQLLRELIRSVVVAAVCDIGREIDRYQYMPLPAYPKMPYLRNTGCGDAYGVVS